MSQSIKEASIPVHWCTTANHVHTDIRTCAWSSLACACGRLVSMAVSTVVPCRPIWRQPQQQHGVLLECRSKPSCCVAAGSRRVRYIIRCTFGQGHAVHVLLLLACSPLSNFAACCIPAAVFLPMSCVVTCTFAAHCHCHCQLCRFACRLNTTPQSMPSRTSEISLPQR